MTQEKLPPVRELCLQSETGLNDLPFLYLIDYSLVITKIS